MKVNKKDENFRHCAPLWALVHFHSVYANQLYLPARNAGFRIVDNNPTKGRFGEAFSHVVLDHGTYVFIWLGATAQEGKSAAALAACRTLSEELTEMRFLAPRILAK
ncbi:hypothetical protein V6N13_124952 [Hibiscus sabdariffa]|uniref:Gelsolin-like domain-containing protein n=1 Tax=Hibiscus sabdariffa TaxID=183260 RepID=A0ABR2U569_9ROSI